VINTFANRLNWCFQKKPFELSSTFKPQNCCKNNNKNWQPHANEGKRSPKMNLMRFIRLLLDCRTSSGYNTTNVRNGRKRVSIKITSKMSVTWDDRNGSAMSQRPMRPEAISVYTLICIYSRYSLINHKHMRCRVSECTSM